MTIRAAIAADLPEIMRLIRLKSEFDGCPHTVQATPQKLKDTLFSPRPMAYILLAEVSKKSASEKSTSKKSAPIGFASYHFTYATFLAQPSIWLDDLFITSGYRNQSIGTRLIQTLCEIAQDHGCGRIDWTVDINNAAGIHFYQRIGAQLQTQVHLCRLNQSGIALGAKKQASRENAIASVEYHT